MTADWCSASLAAALSSGDLEGMRELARRLEDSSRALTEERRPNSGYILGDVQSQAAVAQRCAEVEAAAAQRCAEVEAAAAQRCAEAEAAAAHEGQRSQAMEALASAALQVAFAARQEMEQERRRREGLEAACGAALAWAAREREELAAERAQVEQERRDLEVAHSWREHSVRLRLHEAQLEMLDRLSAIQDLERRTKAPEQGKERGVMGVGSPRESSSAERKHLSEPSAGGVFGAERWGETGGALVCRAPRAAVPVSRGVQGRSAAAPELSSKAASAEEEAKDDTDTASASGSVSGSAAPSGFETWETVSLSGDGECGSEEGPRGGVQSEVALRLASRAAPGAGAGTRNVCTGAGTVAGTGAGAEAGPLPMGASPISKKMKRLGVSSRRNSQLSLLPSGQGTAAATGETALVRPFTDTAADACAKLASGESPGSGASLKRKGLDYNATQLHANHDITACKDTVGPNSLTNKGRCTTAKPMWGRVGCEAYSPAMTPEGSPKMEGSPLSAFETSSSEDDREQMRGAGRTKCHRRSTLRAGTLGVPSVFSLGKSGIPQVS